MGDAKSIFLRDSELSQRWSGFINGPDAERVFAFADAEMMNLPSVDMEQIRGAQRYKEILKGLAEVESPPPPLPTSGIHHNLDPIPRTQKKEKKK